VNTCKNNKKQTCPWKLRTTACEKKSQTILLKIIKVIIRF
jgi:hypothetical protein